MSNSFEDGLRKQADELGDNGEKYYGPTEGQTLEVFQADFRRAERYESEGLLDIVGEPHKESMSGHSYVDRFRVKLTEEGVERWGSKP